jgi:electron transport complex protein RnfE
MGAVRELLGQGTLFSQADLLFGESVGTQPLLDLSLDRGLLVAILPPGAFIVLGLFIAARNLLTLKQQPAVSAHSIQTPVK